MQPYHDGETLRELYWERGMSTEEIGDRFDVAGETIRKWMERNDIDRRTGPEDPPWRDEERLRRMYWDERMSTLEIADELGTYSAIIGKWMERFGIERRNLRQAHANKAPYSVGFHTREDNGYERFKVKFDYETDQVSHHRLLAVAVYGIDAVKGATVHHRNGIPWDNRHDNLALYDTQSEHIKENHENKRNDLGQFTQ